MFNYPPCIAHYKVDILCVYKVGFRSPLYIPTMGPQGDEGPGFLRGAARARHGVSEESFLRARAARARAQKGSQNLSPRTPFKGKCVRGIILHRVLCFYAARRLYINVGFGLYRQNMLAFHFIDSRHVAGPVYTRLFSIKSAAKHLASCTWGMFN